MVLRSFRVVPALTISQDVLAGVTASPQKGGSARCWSTPWRGAAPAVVGAHVDGCAGSQQHQGDRDPCTGPYGECNPVMTPQGRAQRQRTPHNESLPTSAAPTHRAGAPGASARRPGAILLKKACSDASATVAVAVDMDPLSLLCRLATSVPPPRLHTVRYVRVRGCSRPGASGERGSRRRCPRPPPPTSPSGRGLPADTAGGRSFWPAPLPWTCSAVPRARGACGCWR